MNSLGFNRFNLHDAASAISDAARANGLKFLSGDSQKFDISTVEGATNYLVKRSQDLYNKVQSPTTGAIIGEPHAGWRIELLEFNSGQRAGPMSIAFGGAAPIHEARLVKMY